VPDHPRSSAFRALAAAAVVAALVPEAAGAQVGHDPATSPYRAIRHGSYLVLDGGYFFGSGGRVGVTPHNGPTVGLRATFLANQMIQVGGGVAYGNLEHLVVNPAKPPATRTSGPITQGVLWIEGALHFNVTGGKTWHGLAPFGGAAIGVSFSEEQNLPGDYDFGTKFVFAPLIGTRFFVDPRLHIHLEARAQFWQAEYAESYRRPPIEDLLSEPVIPDGQLSEWLVTPWIRVGLGYAVSWPF
jgi:hypothetical protein